VLAICKCQHHNSSMTTSITIRGVPDDARDELAARAAATGRSLQEYLRAQLIDLASHPDVETVLARIQERKQRTGTRLPTDKILAHRNADRR
jgi:plasmid stability protein